LVNHGEQSSRWRRSRVSRAEQLAAAPRGGVSSAEQSRHQEAAEGGESRVVVELGVGAPEVVGFTVTLMGCEPRPVFYELQSNNKEPSRFPSRPAD
jgi:hypothetical protein